MFYFLSLKSVYIYWDYYDCQFRKAQFWLCMFIMALFRAAEYNGGTLVDVLWGSTSEHCFLECHQDKDPVQSSCCLGWSRVLWPREERVLGWNVWINRRTKAKDVVKMLSEADRGMLLFIVIITSCTEWDEMPLGEGDAINSKVG